MKKFGKFKMPNAAITDNSFSYSAKRVAAVLFCHCNRLGAYRKSLDGLSDLCQLSVPTVRKAVAELEAAGFISRRKCYVHDDVQNRPIYAQTEYCCNLSYRGGYTLIPRSLLSKELTPAAFTVSLFIFHQMGNLGRAFPSITYIGSALAMSRSTVCRALAAVKSAYLFLVQLCRKRDKSFANNSYFVLNGSACAAAAAPVEREGDNLLNTENRRRAQREPRGEEKKKAGGFLQYYFRAARRQMQRFWERGVVPFFTG
jgi:Transcriptional regulators